MSLRRLLSRGSRRSSRAANDSNATSKQTSATSSVADSIQNDQHARNTETPNSSQLMQSRPTSRMTMDDIAALNARYPSRTGLPDSPEFQKMVSGYHFRAKTCSQLTTKKVEARRFCAKYNLDEQVLQDQDNMPLDEVFTKLREIREAMLRTIIGRVGQGPVIEPPFNFGYGCNIVMGDRVYANVNFRVMDSALVVIGNDVHIGPNVTIVTELHPKEIDQRYNVYARPVVIEDYCWIAANTVVLPGVIIGRGSVVAAGSVVARDIPPESLAMGVPAVRKTSVQKSEAPIYLN